MAPPTPQATTLPTVLIHNHIPPPPRLTRAKGAISLFREEEENLEKVGKEGNGVMVLDHVSKCL